MADRPILFSAPMVRGLLAGRKTQTRRILKSSWRELPIQNLKEYGLPGANYSGRFNDPHSWGWPFMEEGSDMPLAIWPELWGYKIGDRLWVREAWRTEARYDALRPSEIPSGALCSFEADYDYEPNDGCRGKYRHARFMPR